MGVVKGKVVSVSEPSEPEKEIEYMTAPVPVSKFRFSFGAAVVIQIVIALITGGLYIWAVSVDNETAVIVENVIRRLIYG